MKDRQEISCDDAAKQKRRAQRKLRMAHARGLMQGIVSMLQPGDVVLDCGANVGEVCGLFAQTGAQVHAFEPDPYAFEILSEKLGDMSNLTLHNVAVGVEAGTIPLMRAANFDANPRGGSVKSTIVKGGRNINEDDAAVMDVTLVNLLDVIDDLVARYGRIAVLKMDIEGAELDILEQMLANDLFRHIGLTVAETHERKFRDLRPRFRALRKAVAVKYPVTQVNLDWI